MNIAPILLIIYKRFDTAKKVLDSIRPAKPRKLYIAANAPASDSNDEIKAVERARSVIDEIDWECEVITLFRDKHLKVGKSVPSSISWFFSHEEAGIILEDDCVTSPDFLFFASEMLLRYKNHENIFQISACSLKDSAEDVGTDYFFSKFPMIWGWATWAKVWRPFDQNSSNFKYLKFYNSIKTFFPSRIIRFYWILSQIYTRSGKRDTWDSAWTASVWERGGLTIIPKVNLVSNIGFGPVSTNTQSQSCSWSAMSIKKFPPPWNSPSSVDIDLFKDKYILNQFYGAGRPWLFNIFKLLILIIMPNNIKKMFKAFLNSQTAVLLLE